MKKSLVIVESPAKSKTIEKILGEEYVIQASMGHVRDLPKDRFGVDVAKDFQPTYVPIPGRQKTLTLLKKAAKSCSKVYLATDPDREGEAIGWHVATALSSANVPFIRVTFNEITSKAVLDAFQSPRELDMALVEAQQARRILDRLVGYKLSPVLWKKVGKNLSAGRVQSVAVRLVYTRELEIESFKQEEYWTLDATLKTPAGAAFKALVKKRDGAKLSVSTGEQAEAIKAEMEAQSFVISTLEVSDRNARQLPPFITSTLQQEAFRRLHMPSEMTMRIAQQLYEGVEGPKGGEGLITYMRTDSVHVSEEMLGACRAFIVERYGDAFVPKKPPRYASAKGAQEAHEAIRPTHLNFTPEEVKAWLSKEQFALYDLIWRRFLGSQMTPARLRQTDVTVMAGPFELDAKGTQILFDGAWKVYPDFASEETFLPAVEKGMVLTPEQIDTVQHFTKPPSRYNDASLVKALEENGIGRPSTYAPILATIRKRGYVERQKGRYMLTRLGRVVTELLVDHFSRIMDVEFTAKMEGELDKVERGDMKGIDLLRPFYESFTKDLDEAAEKMRSVKKVVEETDFVCEKCGSKFVVRNSLRGEFLACSGFPKCRNTKTIKRDEQGGVQIVEPEQTDEVCEKCGSKMIVKRGRYGPFLACSGYPECSSTRPLKEEERYPCPMEGCEGKVTPRRSKAGRRFYGCDSYPKCKFALWNPPVNKACPTCGFGLTQTVSVSGENRWRCPQKGCTFDQVVPESEGETSPVST